MKTFWHLESLEGLFEGHVIWTTF